MGLFSDRLGPKLNLFLLGFVLLLGLTTAGLIIYGFQRTQDEATNSSREGLEEEGQQSLQTETRLTASFGQAQLETTAGFAQQAARYLADVDDDSANAFDTGRLTATANGVTFDSDPQRRTDVFLPAGVAPDAAAVADIEDSRVLDQLFPTLLQGFDAQTRSSDFESIAIYFQSVNHVTRMFPPVADIEQLPPDPDLQFVLDRAGPDENPQGATYWSVPYQDAAGRGWVITAIVPVYDEGAYRGVMGVDLSIERLRAQVDAVRPTASGFAFYIDREGNLLPTSRAGDVEREMNDPGNEEFASIVQGMQDGGAAVERAQIGGRDMYVAYTPLGGVGGTFAEAAPVDELTQQAALVEDAIDDGGRNTLLFTLLAIGIILAAGLAAAAWFSRRLILQPIGEVVDGTRAIAAGDLETRIPVRSGDELGVLADSFNTMSGVLSERTEALRSSEAEMRALFQAMPDLVVRLNREGRYLSIASTRESDQLSQATAVEGRTVYETYPAEQAKRMMEPVFRALDTGKTQSVEYSTEFEGVPRWFNASVSPMSETEVIVVSRDVTDRREQEQELREREEQYRSTFESTSDGLIITRIEDGAIIEVNHAMCEMHGYTREEFRALHPTNFIHPDDHHLFASYIETVAAGGEYRCRARDTRKDGSVFHVEVLGTPVTYSGTRHILGVVRDMTATVEAEQILEERVESRTRELLALLRTSQAVASTLDIKGVGTAILQELAEVAEYRGGTLLTVEDDDLVMIDAFGPYRDEVVTGPTARFPLSAVPKGFWEAMTSGLPWIIENVQDESDAGRDFRNVFRPFLQLRAFRGIRSFLAVPLISKGNVVGMLTAAHDNPGHFTPERANFIVVAASHAAVAMDNARLFQQTEERTRELQTLLDVSTNVASTIDLDALVRVIVEQVVYVADYDRASVLILEDDGSALKVMTLMRKGESHPAGAPPDTRFPVEEAPLMWAEFNAGRAVIIDDVRSEDDVLAGDYRISAAPRTDPALAYTRSWMAVPLITKERVIGIVALSSERVGAYTRRQADLTASIATQAASAMENARLFSETEERTRELQTLLNVSTDVASTIELQPLMQLILEQLSRVADYDRASMLTLEDSRALRLLAVLDRERSGLQEIPTGLMFPLQEGVPLWLELSSGRSVLINDVQADTEMARSFRETVAPQTDPELKHIRSWMAVPISLKDRVVGIFALSSGQAGTYTPRQAGLAMAIGAQAAVAIENARLFEQTEERTKELATLLDLSRNVASTIELQPLMDLILEQVRYVAPYDGATVLILHGDRVRVEAESRDPSTIGLEFPIAGSLLWERTSSGSVILIDDVRGDTPEAEAWRRSAGPLLETRYAHVRSWLGVPILLGDRPLGMLALSGHTERVFTEQHARLARAVADQAAVAIENASLYAETDQSNRESGALLEITKSLTSTLDLQSLVRVILAQLGTVVDYTGSSVVIVNRNDELEILSSRILDPPDTPESSGVKFPLQRESTTWQMLLQGETVVIDDIHDDSVQAREYRATIGEALKTDSFRRIRSWMAVPLAIKDRVIGLLSMSRTEVGYFTQAHARIASAVGQQAAVAIENARLFQEAESRTRELAALLDVSKDIASTLDRGALVRGILAQLRSIVDYNGASVIVREGDELVILDYDRDAETADIAVPSRFPLSSVEPMWSVMQRGRELITEDVRGNQRDEENFRSATGDLLDTAFSYVRSMLSVPLIVQDRVIGLVMMSHMQPGHFTQDHARVVRAVADQAALALENARLFEEARQRARETEALLRADAELYRSLSLDDVFQALCDVAVEVLGVHKTMVTTIDDAEGRYTVRASRNIAEASLAKMTEIRKKTPRAALAKMREPIVNADARAEMPEMRPVFEIEDIHSTIDIPIRIDGQVQGDFSIAYNQPYAPTPGELRLFQALADRASVAIQNAELYERAQQVASLEERQRLARELHDSVSQALYGIALGARTARTQLDRDASAAVEPMEYVLSLAEAGLAEMRALIFELRPESLQTEGLVAAIEKQVASTRARYNLDVEADLGIEPAVKIEVKEALYRVAQEALHNIVKHAHAEHVVVSLDSSNGAIALQVRDDGRGFDPGGSYPGHVGLHSMRERIDKLHGTIEIKSAPGAGTSVNVRVPVPSAVSV